MQEHWANADAAASGAELPAATGAAGIARGTARLLVGLGYRTLAEVALTSGRRADLMGVDRHGGIVIVEVKASRRDFRADGKWPEYLAFCDAFYFAVAPDFPREVLPADTGLIVADRYEAAMVREAPRSALVAARRRAMTLRFARTAAARLMALTDAGLALSGRED